MPATLHRESWEQYAVICENKIERLQTALRRVISLDEKNVPKYAQQIAREALKG